jgi:peptidoglycan/LPS O-acetylase OafA/YrhL
MGSLLPGERTMGHPTTNCDDRGSRRVESRHAFYHPELDVLRFFAFLAVFFHHALPRKASDYLNYGFSPMAAEWVLDAKEAGAYGVDLFFVLSSYLITELLLREHAASGRINVSAFYIRRALRIWPLYFTFLAITVFIVPGIFADEKFGPLYITSFALFFGNWVCAIYGLPFSVATPLWSISVEEQFYLAWPLLLLLFGVNRIKHLVVGMVVLALATRTLLALYDVGHPGVWCNTLARLDSIAIGAILAVSLAGRSPCMRYAFRFLLFAAAVTGFLLVARYLRQNGPLSIVTYSATALASVMLLVAVLQGDASFLRRRPFSWFVYLGRISYGLYVFHLLALALLPRLVITVFGVPPGIEQRVVLSFVLTVGLAATSYRWLEQPFLRLKKRFAYTEQIIDKRIKRSLLSTCSPR